MLHRITLLTLFTLATAIPEPQFEKFEPNSDIIEHTMGKAYLYTDVWTIVNSIDLQGLVKQGAYIENYLSTLNDICQKRDCIRKFSIQILQKKLDLAKSVENIISQTHKINKRGIFNPVGELHKILWGTLSNSDAEYYNNEIDKLYNHTNNLASIVQNQTRIIKHTINDFTRHLNSFNKNIGALEKWSLKVNENLSQFHADEQMLEIIQEFTLAIDEYDHTLRDIINALYASKSGVISPSLMSPDVLMDSLRELHDKDPFVNLLIPIDIAHYITYIKVSDIVVYVNGTRLNTILRIPIPESDDYNIMRVQTIPVKIGEDKFKMLHIAGAPVLMTEDRRHYSNIDNLNACSKLDDKFICKRKYITREVEESCLCDIELLRKQGRYCEYKFFSLHSDFIDLINKDSWYIVPINQIQFSLICEVYIREVTINEPSIIKLKDTCLLRNNRLTIRPFREVSSQRVSFINSLNLTTPNISLIELPKLHLTTTNNRDLLHDADDLKNIETKLEELKKEKRSHYWYSTSLDILSYLGYLSIGLIVVWLLVRVGVCGCIWRCFIGLFIKLWNSLCCKPCQINYYNNVFSPQAPTYMANYTASSNDAAVTINRQTARPLLARSEI